MGLLRVISVIGLIGWLADLVEWVCRWVELVCRLIVGGRGREGEGGRGREGGREREGGRGRMTNLVALLVSAPDSLAEEHHGAAGA
jgi:hypothetical protein